MLEITASIVPCVMNVQTHNDNGETVWEVMYNDEGYGTEKNCQYQLIPNYENAEILYVEFRELYLVSKSGTCSALFEINGKKFLRSRKILNFQLHNSLMVNSNKVKASVTCRISIVAQCFV